MRPSPARPRRRVAPRPAPSGIWAAGERITWVAGLVLALSSFMGWYAGSGVGVKLAVIGWHSGVLGKLVFFIGLAVLALVALRESGFELPPTVPESLLVLALGALGADLRADPDDLDPRRGPARRRARDRHLDQPDREPRRDRSAGSCAQQKSCSADLPRSGRDELLRALDQLLRVERLADEPTRAALLGIGGCARRPGRRT